MSRHFERDMQNLHNQVLTLFGVVEKMIDNAMRALCEQQTELANEVLRSDDLVNNQDVLIEEECLKILALHQPVAMDLRRVATMLKINSDLERIADLACNVAERAIVLADFPYFPIPDLLPKMATDATEMVRLALNAFVDLNAETAKEVIRRDQKVDDANRKVIEELEGKMAQEPDKVVPALQCFSASRHLERIGDHAENIAEDVIYLITGEIVRHKHGNFSKELTTE
jgi:phosphate transport system protein